MINNIIELLKLVPIFEDFSLFELQTIAPLFTQKKYKKGTVIFFVGDSGEDFYIIKSGLVKIYHPGSPKEVILAIFREGDFFGDMALLQEGIKRSATAETLEATTVFNLSRKQFLQFLEKYPHLMLKLLTIMGERLRKANEQIQDLTFLDVRTRIYKTVLRLMDEYGSHSHNRSSINIKLTHQQVANLVGTVRESVTKVFLEMQEEGIISIENKKIYINDISLLRKKIINS
jgi:CRP/FNR family cyclic AMP-dependent transcriptional regulator